MIGGGDLFYLAFITKVIERLVCRQLVAFFERLRLLPSVQSAFDRDGCTDVLRAADRGEVSLLCMLDLSAAFDTVHHDILIGRLQQSFAVKRLALSWIESYLRTRRSQSPSMGCSRLHRC